MVLHSDIKEYLIRAARANLNNYDFAEFIRLIEGDYAEDEAALRGFIWGCIEEYGNEL